MKDISKSRINGVHKFLRLKGFGRDIDHRKIVNNFCSENGIVADTFRRKCKAIQADFTPFVKYVNNL
ncbi:MAG: hypothetical protein VKL60_14925 [Sphaerospermopsis sp.]|nr:hypothetical protein [Sphaerospermopsis sp.]